MDAGAFSSRFRALSCCWWRALRAARSPRYCQLIASCHSLRRVGSPQPRLRAAPRAVEHSKSDAAESEPMTRPEASGAAAGGFDPSSFAKKRAEAIERSKSIKATRSAAAEKRRIVAVNNAKSEAQRQQAISEASLVTDGDKLGYEEALKAAHRSAAHDRLIAEQLRAERMTPGELEDLEQRKRSAALERERTGGGSGIGLSRGWNDTSLAPNTPAWDTFGDDLLDADAAGGAGAGAGAGAAAAAGARGGAGAPRGGRRAAGGRGGGRGRGAGGRGRAAAVKERKKQADEAAYEEGLRRLHAEVNAAVPTPAVAPDVTPAADLAAVARRRGTIARRRRRGCGQLRTAAAAVLSRASERPAGGLVAAAEARGAGGSRRG